MRITALEQSRAVEKILFTLYYLLYQFGDSKGNDEFLLDLKLTHATIASLVGLTRETTATELNKLKKKGVLTYTKKIYTVNRKKLEHTLGEDSFAELIDIESKPQ
jgi:CRP-like cAMP-binding protein